MARKRKGQKAPSFGMAAEQQRGKGKRIERYEDTLEEGGVDDFMFKRDQIMFNPQDEESDEDLADVGEEVMSIPTRQRERPVLESGNDEDDEELEDQSRKKRKEKVKADVLGKGRFGKPIVDSDESDDDEASGSGSGSGSGSDSDREEGWGRQYYSMPSTRREKEKEGEYDEKREEERELEEREVRRLQRKAREALSGGDYGLEDEEVDVPLGRDGAREVEDGQEAVPVPESTDPAVLLRYMEVHEPVKLALAREWPLVVKKLEKTQKGIRKMEADPEGQLHRGLGWLHYQTLLAYASTLAFYIHLTCLPRDQRPDLSSHPIMARLLDLKKGLADLEELDFDAASVSGDALVPTGWASDADGEVDPEEEEEELRQLVKAKKELIARLIRGSAGTANDDGDEDEDEDEDGEWKKGGLEAGELAELLADAEMEPIGADEVEKKKRNKKKAKGETDESSSSLPIKKSKTVAREKTKTQTKKAKSDSAATAPSQTLPLFPTLSEPAFFSGPSKPSQRLTAIEDDLGLGDPTSLLDADAEDKDRRKRSLAFHTSKIASTANRRAAAREKRSGGDEDIPYRDRQAARDAALRKQNRGDASGPGAGEALSGREMTGEEKKRARDVRDELGEDQADIDDGEGYYDLIKRSKTAAKADKAAKQQEAEDERMEQLREIDREGEGVGGPRSLTRAIEKNRGLTPRRSKAGRNPRVKKRLAYEKAKQKVGSQRAVYKGGEGGYGGKYAGERTGISTVVKSRQF